MKSVSATPAEDPLLASYQQLANGLVSGLTGICLLNHELRSRGHTQEMNGDRLLTWVNTLNWIREGERTPTASSLIRGSWTTAVALEQSDGTLLGVFCIQQKRDGAPTQPTKYAQQMQRALKPLLDCIHRELVAALPVQSRIQALNERTAELEWLFKVTDNLKTFGDDRHVLEELVAAAAQRLESALGVIYIPGKRVCIEQMRDSQHATLLLKTWKKTKTHLLNWVQRHNKPLVIGRSNGEAPTGRCSILGVPIVRESGQVIGLLAFYNPPNAPPFASKHSFLARHLGRQAAAIVESQFDLMTGLYTRGGLEQASGRWVETDCVQDRCIVYIDVDHMQLVNELHGFELGNELIVRIADLLAPPRIPEGAIAARISADRFAVLVSTADTAAAADIAECLRAAARRLTIGPPDNVLDVSISCGVASFVPMPQGLDRALAMAELACKAAKRKGRDRVETYACSDSSMIRRHGDVVAVGQLRAALRANRLVLYAQRIVPLRSTTLAGGYEILVRMIDEDGALVLPGPLIQAAERYQLLPNIDRWVTQRALEMLAPYRNALSTRGLSMSLNVSGQSIGDAAFVDQLAQNVKTARLPADCIMVEITEQSAVTNLARANELIQQLRVLGCKIALDDFGTGANSLTYLKNLQITRVKIDGSFIRDIVTDRNSRATVRAIVELADGMSIDTVAEYVETQAIADEVRNLGVDYAQGYAFGRPEPLSDILSALSDDESRRLHRLFLET